MARPRYADSKRHQESAVPKFFLQLRRLLSLTTAISMAMPALPASAQEAAPPARVGQIAGIIGGVSFSGSGSGGWAAASLNYPVSDGDSLYTQAGAQASIALDASKITLAGGSELQITQLDENVFAATESQGEVFLRVNDLQPGQSFSIATPRGTASITQNGAYDLAAGDASAPTVITVFQGAATISAPGATLQVPPGQAGVLSGTDQTTAQLGQAEPDAFASSMLAEAAPPPPPYVPQLAEQMTGTTELATYGSWDSSPQYGAIWYPRVDAGWAPYREGHWVFAAPWGWTWVDNEPWGFAPFHYGRWVDEDNRWGWAPCPAYQGGDSGPQFRPVYAPAVVSFFGLGVAAGITAAALSSGRIGWVPLGPNEAYYPAYRASPDYVRRINLVNVRNINTVNVTNHYYGDTAPDHFANRRAATFIPAADMSRGAPVARDGRPVSETDFRDARPMTPGFAAHAANGQPEFRLPNAAAPLASAHPGFAPQASALGDRSRLPQTVISRQPAASQIRPPAGQPFFHPQGEAHRPAEPQVFRPQGEAARPAAPAFVQPQAQRPAQIFAPQQQPQRPPQVFTPQPAIQRPVQTFGQPQRLPQAEAPRPVAPQVFRPQAESPPIFHPQQPEAPRTAPAASPLLDQHQTH